MNQYELMILIIRKNSRILSTYVKSGENRKRNIIRIKGMIASLKPHLYNIIKAMAMDFERFYVEKMFTVQHNGCQHFVYQRYINNGWQHTIYRPTGREFGLRKNQQIQAYDPWSVWDYQLNVTFIIEYDKIVNHEQLVLFSDEQEYKAFSGVVSAIVVAKKREEDAIKQAKILKKEEENQKKKDALFAQYI